MYVLQLIAADGYVHRFRTGIRQNGINFVAGLFYTGMLQTKVMIRTAAACGMHMFLYMIRIGSDRKVFPFVAYLTALFFA